MTDEEKAHVKREKIRLLNFERDDWEASLKRAQDEETECEEALDEIKAEMRELGEPGL